MTSSGRASRGHGMPQTLLLIKNMGPEGSKSCTGNPGGHPCQNAGSIFARAHLSMYPFREAILDRCLGRLEWEKVKETEAKREAAIKEAERVATQSIDW